MKISLPNKKGFTLIELLVAITIIAILSTIGLTVFSGLQGKARDSRRKTDIDAIAKALEVNKSTSSATYQPLLASQFANQNLPQDPQAANNIYCVQYNTGSTSPVVPVAGATQWATCPTNPATYTPLAINQPTAASNTTVFTVCALLEEKENLNYTVYCRSNQQ